MPAEDLQDAEVESVAFVVTNLRQIQSKSLFALVDVEMRIAGVSFEVLGVQARRTGLDGASVFLPTYKDTDGTWKPAIRLPDEVRVPLGNAVLEFLVEQGVLIEKFTRANSTD
jgi:stage V sporulation protein G